MMKEIIYKIHFTDNYGPSTLGCETTEQFREALQNINDDPMCEDIWCEYYDQEEGWQA